MNDEAMGGALTVITKQTKVSIAFALMAVLGTATVIHQIDSKVSGAKDMIRDLIENQRRELRDEFVTKEVFEAHFALMSVTLEQIQESQRDVRELHRELRAFSVALAENLTELKGQVSSVQREVETLSKERSNVSPEGGK